MTYNEIAEMITKDSMVAARRNSWHKDDYIFMQEELYDWHSSGGSVGKICDGTGKIIKMPLLKSDRKYFFWWRLTWNDVLSAESMNATDWELIWNPNNNP